MVWPLTISANLDCTDMKRYDILKCASFAASYTDYQDFLSEDGSKTQTKTWTFTAEDLKKFVIALELEKQ